MVPLTRPQLCLLGLGFIVVLDLLLPAQIPLLPYYWIPVVFAATFATPHQVMLLTGTAVGLSIAATWSEALDRMDLASRLLGLTGVGAMAALLAAQRQRQELRQRQIEVRWHAEALFSQAVLGGTVGVALLDPDGAVLHANPAIGKMLGLAREALIGRSWPELLLEADQFKGHQQLERLVAGEQRDGRLRLRFPRADGETVWGDISLAALHNPMGQLNQLVAQVVDVSAAVRSASELAEQEHRFRMLTETSSDVVVVSDAEERIIWVSAAVASVLGWRQEQLVGRDLNALVHPVERERLQALRRQLRLKERSHVPLQAMELRLSTGSGEFLWMSAKGSITPDLHGGVSEEVIALRDIDALVQSQTNLNRERQRLKAILDSLLDAQLSLDPLPDPCGGQGDFRIEEANPAACRSLGRSRSRLVGLRLTELLPSLPATGLLTALNTCLNGGEPLILDNHPYPAGDLHDDTHWYDLRAVRVGEGLILTLRDVTERQLAAERLARSEEQYRLLAENATDVVLRLHGGVIVWVSRSLESMLGWTPIDWVGRAPSELVAPDEVERLERELESIERGERVVSRYRVSACDGRLHWIETHANRYVDGLGRHDGVVMSFRTIDREVEVEQELQRRARTDELTGLLNRRDAIEQMQSLRQRQTRTGKARALLFCDLDHFKGVNDSLGHQAGDEALRTVAVRLRGCLRSGDLAARMGGDELLVLLDGVQDLANAAGIAETIRRCIAEPIDTSAGPLQMSLSIGVTLMDPGESTDAVISRADVAMYKAKQQGRDQVFAIPSLT